jgi:outer membrane protein assembly factor BamB
VIVNGVVYVQDLDSDVFAIGLAAGKVLWTHDYNSPNGGPDGVNLAGGVVYAATAKSAVALDAATGAQLWSRTLIGNDHEGIAMAPGYNHGTVYVSTVPANVTGQYLPGGEGILWALNAKTGAPEWSWNQVQNLWGNPGVNSGGGLWYTPSISSRMAPRRAGQAAVRVPALLRPRTPGRPGCQPAPDTGNQLGFLQCCARWQAGPGQRSPSPWYPECREGRSSCPDRW